MKIAIIGAGKFGTRITEALVDGDYDIVLIDLNVEKLNSLEDQYDVATVVGDAHRINVLKQIGIEKYDCLIACTSDDDTNIFAASSAKALGCKKVIARVTAPEQVGQNDFIKQNFHIDEVVNPDLFIANEINRYLVEKYSLKDGVYTLKRIALIEVDAKNEPRVVGKPINAFREILPNTLVVGICRHGKVLIPHGNDIIEQSDILYLVGEKKEMLGYASNIHDKTKAAHNIMIIGGGRTGFYLAQKLSEYGASVKIVESNKKRCVYLSNNIPNVMVLNGNGTDMGLLEEENFDTMDAFITATGFDEENLLLALAAKQRGVDEVISKISHERYDDMISELGIDVVLNPLDITAGRIVGMVSGKKRVLSSVLLQGQAELLEIYVENGNALVNKELKDLDMPDYAIIAAINRGTKTIIPKGDDKILVGDHLIIVCLLSHIGYIEKILKPVKKK